MSTSSNKRMRLDKDQANIVIVGGGLAGLSAAVALEKAGFTKISLFERDVSFEQQKEGYGLTLTYNPKGPLASLGILEQVAQHDCPSRSHYLFQVSGCFLFFWIGAAPPFVSPRLMILPRTGSLFSWHLSFPARWKYSRIFWKCLFYTPWNWPKR